MNVKMFNLDPWMNQFPFGGNWIKLRKPLSLPRTSKKKHTKLNQEARDEIDIPIVHAPL
jgi:hypothetical protein